MLYALALSAVSAFALAITSPSPNLYALALGAVSAFALAIRSPSPNLGALCPSPKCCISLCPSHNVALALTFMP